MSTKNAPGRYDCYAAALPDEPYFVLLARDPRAPALVRLWADQRRADIIQGERNMDDLRQCQEADECADQMAEWRNLQEGIWQSPDDKEGTAAHADE